MFVGPESLLLLTPTAGEGKGEGESEDEGDYIVLWEVVSKITFSRIRVNVSKTRG